MSIEAVILIILAIPTLVFLKVWIDGTGFFAGTSIMQRHPCNDPAWTRAAEKIRRHPRLYGAGHFNLLDATRLGCIVVFAGLILLLLGKAL